MSGAAGDGPAARESVAVARSPLLLLFAIAVSGCAGGGAPPGPPQARAEAARANARGGAPSVIKHVVVIIQENRTVDNLFNGFPGADTVRAYVDPAGRIVLLQPLSLAAPVEINHSHSAFVTDFAGGSMNGWPAPAYSYVPQRETQRYFSVAGNYGFADHVLQANEGPSFPAHQYLIAGQSGGFDTDREALAENVAGQTTCAAKSQPAVAEMLMTSDYPGDESGSAFPCKNYGTIFDLLDAAHYTWRYYVHSITWFWSGPTAVSHIWFGPDRANIITPETNVLTDIANGALPTVAYVTPSVANSDHARGSAALGYATDPEAGQKWVASIVNAIGESAYWKDTAIFVTWDDWGGWFDHYKPNRPANSPQDPYEYGFRVPLVAISPYVIPHRVDHTERSYVAILRFIETTFGLPSLGSLDALEPDDLTSMFDFSERPLQFVPM